MDSNSNGKQNNNSEREPRFSVNFFLDPCQGIHSLLHSRF